VNKIELVQIFNTTIILQGQLVTGQYFLFLIDRGVHGRGTCLYGTKNII